MKQTRDTNNIIFSSIHNERQHHTPEPPKTLFASCGNNIIFSSIHNERQHHTPEPPKTLLVPHEANAWHQQHHLL